MKRETITPVELRGRLSAMRPSVLLVDGIEDGRIVAEVAGPDEFGPGTRAHTVYAMSSATWDRVADDACVRHMVDVADEVNLTRIPGDSGLRSVIIGVMTNGGLREWEIRL